MIRSLCFWFYLKLYAERVSKHSLGEQIVEEIRDRVQHLSNPPLHLTDDLQSCLYVNVDPDNVPISQSNQIDHADDINMSDSETLHLSQSTVASNWSDMQKSSRERYNDAMQMLTNGHMEYLCSQASQPLQDLQYSTRHTMCVMQKLLLNLFVTS